MRKYVMTTLLLGALCAGCVLKIEAAVTQQDIARSVIRFHVIADSDKPQDQKVKLKVRDRVIDYLAGVLAGADSAEESRARIAAHLDDVENIALEALQKEQEDKTVTAALVTTHFPEKVYGDCTFPEGSYEALQVKIGKAKGRNWWCVLYPGLCFEYSIRGVVTEEGKEKLSGVLTEEDMETILHEGKVKVRFRWF